MPGKALIRYQEKFLPGLEMTGRAPGMVVESPSLEMAPEDRDSWLLCWVDC